MTTKYTNEAHRQYLDLLAHVGQRWLAIFEGDTAFYSAHYWDLLTTLWEYPGPMRKTDALAAMKTVRSAHTAGKYLDAAISAGILVETGNPKDARSRLVTLSDDMRAKIDAMFDDAVDELCASASRIERMKS
ncbi:MAG: hypothetical protein RIC16_10320 [Rhodospirillales bacterium]